MTDLFAKPRKRVGQGNADFLTDLATNVSDATMRQRYAAGGYPDLHHPSIHNWRRLAGRSNQAEGI